MAVTAERLLPVDGSTTTGGKKDGTPTNGYSFYASGKRLPVHKLKKM